MFASLQNDWNDESIVKTIADEWSVYPNTSVNRLIVSSPHDSRSIPDRLRLCTASGLEQYLICEFEIHTNTITDKSAGLKNNNNKKKVCPDLVPVF